MVIHMMKRWMDSMMHGGMIETMRTIFQGVCIGGMTKTMRTMLMKYRGLFLLARRVPCSLTG